MYRKVWVPGFSFGLAALLAGCAPEAAGDASRDAAAADPALAAAIAEAPTVRVYKTPTCGCCAEWVEHMRSAGFEVDVEDRAQLAAIKAEADLPLQLQSCHTAFIGEYAFEGHVPADVIARFLTEKPAVRGLAVPGMPVGSPGMEMGDRVDRYDVIAYDVSGNTEVYESR